MTIDWQAFTPWQSLAGGALVGFAAVALMMTLGRIMGISGITTGAMRAPDKGWRIAFLAGTVAAPLVYQFGLQQPLIVNVTNSPELLAIGGLLVGIGTRVGSGCTSGHGICGLSRFSLRSLVAVITFIATAMLTVYLLK
ncbi:YeeE/YedE family protein [Yunchengibacter salinarum]|uniref:YeeE/YedE family protein n=1 Tax=Yunchengibacter salinarum TaxID=3133399 RepID=UPI0035B65745